MRKGGCAPKPFDPHFTRTANETGQWLNHTFLAFEIIFTEKPVASLCSATGEYGGT